MSVNTTIDVVVPSFRLDEKILCSIVRLPQPVGFQVNFIVIADNPDRAIPQALLTLVEQGAIQLIRNPVNLGFSGTRNKGIRAGRGQWILLLDDDVEPEDGLLRGYANAIQKKPDAIGFIGVTLFPAPFNTVTTALHVNGLTSHLSAALHCPEMVWSPTTNVMLNRKKMHPKLFDTDLKIGGEDIEFMFRNSHTFGEKYVCVPDAVVTHPWFDNGRIQIKRMFRYGVSVRQIATRSAIDKYSYRDFTNTIESLFL